MSADASATSSEPIAGIRKAATLLVLLGDKVGAELLKLLTEDEVQMVSREIARLDVIPAEQAEALLEEFCQMTMAHGYMLRGGLEYARRMLTSAFGPDAKKMVERLARGMGGDCANLDILQKIDPEQLARFIHNERPQTIALLLSHLTPSQASTLLVSLPSEMRSDVVLRMANLDQISPEIVNKIASVLSRKLQAISEFSRESFGGVHAVAAMFNRLDSGMSRDILDAIEQQNPNLVEAIRHLMFVFEDMLRMDVNQLKLVVDRVDRKILTLALKGTSDQLKGHFLKTMSTRGADMLKDDIESLGPVRIKDVQAAQQQIIAIIRQMEVEGVISLKGAGGDQYVV